MANILKAYPSADRPAGSEMEITGTVVSTHRALDVNVVNAVVEIDTVGLATSAKQDTGNTSLASVDTKLSSQATAAKQDTGNTSLGSIDTKLTTSNTSLSTIATNTTGFTWLGSVYNNYASTNVSDSAYVQLSAALPAGVKALEIFDGGGKAMILALGAALSEVDKVLIPPGGNLPLIPWTASGRLSIKCQESSTTVSSGLLVINLFG